MYLYDFKDSEQFRRLEKKAFDEILDYSAFPGNEYKYFAEIERLGKAYHRDQITREEVKERRVYLFNEYHNAVDEAEQCFPEKIKSLIMRQPTVEYNGGKYYVEKCIFGGHYKEPRWYYQLQLLDKNLRSVMIVDLDEVIKQNKGIFKEATK